MLPENVGELSAFHVAPSVVRKIVPFCVSAQPVTALPALFTHIRPVALAVYARTRWHRN